MAQFSPRITVENWPASSLLGTLLDMQVVSGWTMLAVLSSLIIRGGSLYLFSALWARCLGLEAWLFASLLGTFNMKYLICPFLF